MEITLAHCASIFEEKFGPSEIQISAPGRANIIGEHTDYNQGYVLPFAIDKYIYFVANKSSESVSKVFSLNLNESVEIDAALEYQGFSKFIGGCLRILEEKTDRNLSVNLVFGGNLPIGAGISSSSALCCGFIETLSRLFELKLTATEILQLAITVERGAGVDGGIMDQFSIINAKENHAILLDCLDNSVKFIPFKFDDHSFVIFDTGVEHNLADTAYNDRVKTCRAALATIQMADPSVDNFRMIKTQHLDLLVGKEKDRIEHVLEENERLLKAIELLKLGKVKELGALINLSHFSLRDLYEVSCNELDYIADFLQQTDQVAGARMMGGGFGGSVIGLVEKKNVGTIAQELSKSYKAKFNINLRYFVVNPTDGLIERR